MLNSNDFIYFQKKSGSEISRFANEKALRSIRNKKIEFFSQIPLQISKVKSKMDFESRGLLTEENIMNSR